MNNIIIDGINYGELVKVKLAGRFAYVDKFTVDKLSHLIDFKVVGGYDESLPAYCKVAVWVVTGNCNWSAYSIDEVKAGELCEHLKGVLAETSTVNLDDRHHWF